MKARTLQVFTACFQGGLRGQVHIVGQQLSKEGEHMAGNVVGGAVVAGAEPVEMSPDCPGVGEKGAGVLGAGGTVRS